MRSEAEAAARATARAAARIGLDELLAMRPRRTPPTPVRGGRGPGGERPGLGRARSLDFDGVSPYAPGDDVRAIDWRATARTGALQTRRFAAESHAARTIVLDLRPELWFGLAERLLAKSAALAAARLAWEAEALGEPVGLVAPGIEPLPPRRGGRALTALLAAIADACEAARAGAASPVAEMLAEAAAPLRPRDEIHALGEFAEAEPGLDAAARRLSGRLRLFAWAVEDRALEAPAPAGRYPMLGALGDRLLASVDRAGGARAPEIAAKLRAERRARLRAVGWEPREALDLLPRAAAR